jgi:hypothetical protein
MRLALLTQGSSLIRSMQILTPGKVSAALFFWRKVVPIVTHCSTKLFVNYCLFILFSLRERSVKSDEGGQHNSRTVLLALSFAALLAQKSQFMKQHDMCLKIINFLMYF